MYTNDHTNPNERRPRAFFTPGSGPTPPAGQVRTIPLNTPQDIEADSPTLPMPGVQGLTRPAVPFTRDDAIAGLASSGPYPNKPDLGPVTGWLVILSGPGRGRSAEIGYGRNAIGRGANNEISLPYGDQGVSEQAHAYVAYDGIGRKTYVSDGNSRNLVYLNGSPVLGTVELSNGSTIRIGETELMFVAFCSPTMDWKDIPETIQ